MTGPRVLVTGVTGFVGGHAAEALAARGCTVVAATRRPPEPALPYDARIVGEIDSETKWAGALEGIDTVVHLAARAHVLHDKADDPLALFRRINRDGAIALARQAAAAGVRRFVFASTIKVNGEGTPPGRPFTSDDRPAPHDPYAIAKAEAEQALAEIAAATGLEVVVVRPPLVHGPGAKGNLRALMGILAKGWPLPLGAIVNERSLIGVKNLADALAFCATVPEAAGGTFLVRDDTDISTPDMVRILAEAMGRPARLLPIPADLLRLAGMLSGKGAAVERLIGSLTVDDTPLRRLGWKPAIPLEDGLRAMARAFRLQA